MNDVETRLRDALAARVDAVRTDPAAYAAVVRRRERRGIRRLVTVGVTAVSVAAIGVAVVAVRPTPAPAPPALAPIAPAPDTLIALVDGEARLYRSADPGNGFTGSHPVGYRTSAVAAFGDGTRFVVASRKGCTATLDTFDRVPLHGVEGTVVDEVPGKDVAGWVPRLAVSPDGTRLAYVVLVRTADGKCETTGQVRVRDLTTGAERTWTAPANPKVPFRTGTLSWSPDGTRLALGQQLPVLDVTEPGGTIEYQPLEEITVPGHDFCGLDVRFFRGTTGQSAGVLHCYDDDNPRDEPVTSVYGLGDDGRVGERLFTLPPAMNGWSVTFDRSGDHALAMPRNVPGERPLYRWDRGRGVRRVGTGNVTFESVAW